VKCGLQLKINRQKKYIQTNPTQKKEVQRLKQWGAQSRMICSPK